MIPILFYTFFVKGFLSVFNGCVKGILSFVYGVFNAVIKYSCDKITLKNACKKRLGSLKKAFKKDREP